MRFLLCSSMLCIAALGLTGCGGSDRSPLGTVSGTVRYQGQPIEDGKIIFEVPGARSAYGRIVGGEITEVTTYDVGDGVPVGTARVAVFANEVAGTEAAATPAADPGTLAPMDASYMGSGTSLLPAKFNDPGRSGIEVDITRGHNTLTLDLVD